MTTKEAEFTPSEVFGAKLILMGPPGSGKTWSTATLIPAGFEKILYIHTEPGAEESVIDACNKNDYPMDNIHWHYIPPANPPWDAMIEIATKVNKLSYNDLTELKSGMRKQDHTQFLDLLRVLKNFTCDRTGEEFGPADKWPNTYCLVLDSLSGVNVMAYGLTVGAKPAPHKGEWHTAMFQEENLLNKITSACQCFFVLCAHIDRVHDEVAGRTYINVAALGSKLGPKVPRFFGDQIRTVKNKRDFHWATEVPQHDMKQRLFPISEKLDPNFKFWIDAWLKRYQFSKEDWLAQKTEGDEEDVERNKGYTGDRLITDAASKPNALGETGSGT